MLQQLNPSLSGIIWEIVPQPRKFPTRLLKSRLLEYLLFSRFSVLCVCVCPF